MGDPRKQRRKYDTPAHPWKAERITEEKEICRKYGLKNRKEIWRAKSKTRRFRQQARKLLASSGEEVMKEKKELLDKLKSMGILESPSLEDVLALKTDDLLGRRLQSLVYRKNLSNTIKEARQLVTHGHVLVGSRIINIPSYSVSKTEEDSIRLKEGIRVINLGKGGDGKEAAKAEPEEPKKPPVKEEEPKESEPKKPEAKEKSKKESESKEPKKEK